MKPTFKRLSAAMVATIALAQPQLAMAQECVNQEHVSDATIYVMPMLVSAFTSKCSTELSSDGFMNTRGAAFSGSFEERQDEAWPGAYQLFLSFAAKGAETDPITEMFNSLPEDAVRPFFDAIIEQKVSEEIKLKDCLRIERGIEMLAPLPPENMGGLAAFLLDMSGVDNPSLCPYQQK